MVFWLGPPGPVSGVYLIHKFSFDYDAFGLFRLRGRVPPPREGPPREKEPHYTYVDYNQHLPDPLSVPGTVRAVEAGPNAAEMLAIDPTRQKDVKQEVVVQGAEPRRGSILFALQGHVKKE
jgi:hypothetical protein